MEIVGNQKKIFALQQPDEITFPFIVYQRNSLTTRYTKDYMGWINNVQFEIACVSNDYVQSLELANAVRNAVEWRYIRNEDLYIQRMDIDSINEYSIDANSGTVYVQSILVSMNIQPINTDNT